LEYFYFLFSGFTLRMILFKTDRHVLLTKFSKSYFEIFLFPISRMYFSTDSCSRLTSMFLLTEFFLSHFFGIFLFPIFRIYFPNDSCSRSTSMFSWMNFYRKYFRRSLLSKSRLLHYGCFRLEQLSTDGNSVRWQKFPSKWWAWICSRPQQLIHIL